MQKQQQETYTDLCRSIRIVICWKLVCFHIFHLQIIVQDNTRESYTYKRLTKIRGLHNIKYRNFIQNAKKET